MRSLLKALAISLALASPAAVMAASGAAGGLASTDHDFSSSGFGTNLQTIGLCTYCHTPHSAITQSLLWNHTLSANTFSWAAGEKTAAGTVYPSMAPAYKGPTTKCLSCHDGSVAVGDVAMYRDTAMIGGAANNLTKITGNHQIASAGGSMTGNHPVGMPYPYQQLSNTYNATASGANTVLTEFQSNPTTLGGSNIKLYNDTGTVISGGPAVGTTGMECSTCHDPHNKATQDDYFLRGKIDGNTQAGGYICLQCHIK